MPKQSPISREVVSEVQIDEPIPVEATPAAFADSSKDRHELTWAEGRRLVRAGRTVSPSQKLENDLALAKALYLTRCEYQSGKRRREDREHAAKIGKLAKRLAKLFDERGRRAVRLPLDMECPENYLSRIVECADDAQKPKSASSLDRQLGELVMSEFGIGRMSAFDWLVGQHLPEIFEEHFGIPATARGDRTQPPDTRYVRFAVDALAKLGITVNNKPYARESIARAMSIAKRGGRMGKSNEKSSDLPTGKS